MPKGNTYTLEDIERGLMALAVNAGRPTPASEQTGIPHQTLSHWRDKAHPERYQQILTQAQALILPRIAAQAEANMIRLGELEAALIEDLDQQRQLGKIDPKDMAGALRNVTTSKALNQDKISAPLRGRPTVIEHRHTADESLTRLAALGIIDLDPSDITEQTPPQLEAPSST